MSIRLQCELLSLNRLGVYYAPKGEKPENLTRMKLMDAHMLIEPTAGVLTMKDLLEEKGYKTGYEQVRRLMRLANLYPIYPRRRLTTLGLQKYVHPYLFRDLEIVRPNQVWAIDITYVPMSGGFMYLTGVIDVYSRYIVGWDISNTLDAAASLQVVRQAVAAYGKPEILNSDQGVQFTCELYAEYLKEEKIAIARRTVSMDGKGRALDNVYIEHFWRTIKYQHIYLWPADNGSQLYRGIRKWLERYHSRKHQTIR